MKILKPRNQKKFKDKKTLDEDSSLLFEIETAIRENSNKEDLLRYLPNKTKAFPTIKSDITERKLDILVYLLIFLYLSSMNFVLAPLIPSGISTFTYGNNSE